jgi:uncharacterized membrane protein YGL010W
MKQVSIITKIIEKQRHYLKLYANQHTTLGCRITHMIGVPMIMASLVGLVRLSATGAWNSDFVVLGASALCLVVGWIWQFAGHFFFEKNSPVFLSNPLNLYNYTSAVIFVAQEWGRVVTLGKARA